MSRAIDQAITSNEKEIEFLRACLAHELFSSQPFPQPSPDLNWDRLYHLLNQQRLGAHFYTISKDHQREWPPSFCGQLRLDRYALRLYGAQCAGRIKIILSAFLNAGIPAIVVKGWALIQTIYGGDYSQRFCEDIDVLVQPQDVDSAESVLNSQGYVGEDETWPGYHRRFIGLRPYFLSSQPRINDRLFAVGLHWGLIHVPSYDPDRMDVPALFRHAQPLRMEGADVLTLSVEHQLVYSCAHLDLHHRFDQVLLRQYEIASIMLKAKAALNWDRVIEQALAWRCLLPLKRVLINIERLWPGVVPSSVLGKVERLRATRFERFVDKWIDVTKGNNTWMSILNWLTMPRLRDCAGRAMQDVFPSPAYMQRRYGPAPGGFWPILYLRRFLQAFKFLVKTSASG